MEPSDSDIELLRQSLTTDNRFSRYFDRSDAVPFMPTVFSGASTLMDTLLRLGWMSISERTLVAQRWLSKTAEDAPGWVIRDLPKPVAHGPAVYNFSWPDEAEVLIQRAQDYVRALPANARVLDLCTGSGALAVWLCLVRPDIQVDAVDICPLALADVKLNLRLNQIDTNRVRLIESDLFAAPELQGVKYDLILADPPFSLRPDFVDTKERNHGGPFGDNVSRRILRDASKFLKNDSSRILLLTYSLGGDKLSSLTILSKDAKYPLKLDEPQHLIGSNVWRFRHNKMFSNPMPVEMMIIRLADPFRYESSLAKLDKPDDESLAFVSKYENWLKSHRVMGCTKLWYVLLVGTPHDIDVGGQT